MNAVANYLLSIVCICVIISIASSFFEKNSVLSALFRLLSGLFLAITILAPVKDFSAVFFDTAVGSFQQDSEKWISDGQTHYRQSIEDIIIQETQAYILAKAAALKVYPRVEVFLSDSETPVPQKVVIEGEFSPYVKRSLQNTITEDLGIAKECQYWN